MYLRYTVIVSAILASLLLLSFLFIEGFYFYKVNQLDLKKQNITRTYSKQTHQFLALVENTESTSSKTFTRFIYTYIDLYRNKKLSRKKASLIQKIAADYKKTEKEDTEGFGRQLNNFVTTYWLENNYQTHELINLFLSSVYLGSVRKKNVWGLDQAAIQYFNKDANRLNVHQTIALLSLIKNPHYFNPSKNPYMFEQRNKYIIDLIKINYPTKYHSLQYKAVL